MVELRKMLEIYCLNLIKKFPFAAYHAMEIEQFDGSELTWVNHYLTIDLVFEF